MILQPIFVLFVIREFFRKTRIQISLKIDIQKFPTSYRKLQFLMRKSKFSKPRILLLLLPKIVQEPEGPREASTTGYQSRGKENLARRRVT